ncbi:hypothetical protein BVY04_01580 [bacterium M21]|nr:hypothetical protein BVY04_01580 [bacterium M21]
MKYHLSLFSGIVPMACLIGILTCQSVVGQEFKVIANASTKLQDTDLVTIERLFLGKSRRVNGQSILIVLYRQNEVQRKLARALTNKTENRFLNYWKRMVFTGKAVMPQYVGDETAMIEYVKKNRGAIGFVSADRKVTEPGVIVVNLASAATADSR